ncbi:hypothetical protein BDE02_19G072700 [Populus trichocarpa]|nr:hypothetical protein BDE02_19G072700 [Populus trichocarpa]
MTKAKKELLSKAPWRGEDDDESNKFKDAKLKVTSQPGSTPTMHVPRKKSQRFDDEDDDDQALEIDPELRYSFQRNFQFLQRVFSIDTVVKPLPPAMAYNVSRNLSFFTRIFTQFFGEFDFLLSLGRLHIESFIISSPCIISYCFTFYFILL